MPEADEIPVERGSRDVRQHRSADLDPGAVGQAHRNRATLPNLDVDDQRVGSNPRSGGLGPSGQGLGQLAGPAPRDRESDVLAHHRQQPAEHGTPGRVRRDVAVHRVPGEEQGTANAAEHLASESTNRQQPEPGQVDHPRELDPSQNAAERAYRVGSG